MNYRMRIENALVQQPIFKDTWSTIDRNQLFQQHLKIQFGRPSQYCKNFGICRLEPEAIPADQVQTISSGCNNTHTGSVLLTFSKEWMCFCFPKISLEPETKAYYFSTAYFLVEEDYLFPEGLFELSIASENYLVSQGKYRIFETSWSFELYMRIRKENRLFICEPQLTPGKERAL